MARKRTKVEKVREGKATGINETGEKITYDTEVKKLVYTDGKNKEVIKPKAEKDQSKTPVRQSELVYAKKDKAEHISITGAEVEVDYDPDEMVEAYIGEAYDYYATCQIRKLRLAALCPDKPHEAPLANEVDFNTYVKISLSYWRKQAQDGFPVLKDRHEIKYSPNREEDLSLSIMAAEESIIAYEKFLALDDFRKKEAINNGVLFASQKREEREERKEEAKAQILDEALRSGGDISALLENNELLIN